MVKEGKIEVVGEFEVKDKHKVLEYTIIKVDGTLIAVINKELVNSTHLLKLAGKAAKERGARCLYIYGEYDGQIYFQRVVDLETKQYVTMRYCEGVESNTNKPMECLKFIPAVLTYVATLGW